MKTTKFILVFCALLLSPLMSQAIEYSPHASFYDCGSPEDVAQNGRINQAYKFALEPAGKFYLITTNVDVGSTVFQTTEMTPVNGSKESPDYHLLKVPRQTGLFVQVTYNEWPRGYDVRMASSPRTDAMSSAMPCNQIKALP